MERFTRRAIDNTINSALDLARQGSYAGAVSKLTGKPLPSVEPKAFLIYLITSLVDDPFHADIILASWRLLVGFTEENNISKRQELFILASGYNGSKKTLEGVVDRNAIGVDELKRRVGLLNKHEKRLYQKLAERILELIATKGEDGNYVYNHANIRSLEEAAENRFYDKNLRRVIIPNPSFRNPMPSPSGQIDPRYSHFIGRESILENIKDNFFKLKNPVQILCGMAGVGKTTIANEYIHRNLANYNFIWWLDASSENKLTASCANFLMKEDSGYNGSDDPNYIRNRFRVFFNGRTHWLLIFDNADYFAENSEEETRLLKNLFDHVPAAGGHTIITTRNARVLEKAVIHNVECFEPETSIAYLVEITGQPKNAHTSTLAEKLGYLPLALTYAGNYIKKHTSYEGYLELWYQESLKLWDKQDGHYADRTVRQAFDISLKKIKDTVAPDKRDNVIALLDLCADFEAEYLPIDAYLRYIKSFPNPEK